MKEIIKIHINMQKSTLRPEIKIQKPSNILKYQVKCSSPKDYQNDRTECFFVNFLNNKSIT